MTQTPESNRMDRIERALDGLATNLINERDARWAMRQDLEDFYHTVRGWAESTDNAINRLVENGEADRAAIREMQVEIREMQAEIREIQTEIREIRADTKEIQAESQQIWQYLLSQRPNGDR